MNTCSNLGVTLALIIQHHHLSLNSCLNFYWQLALLKSWYLVTSPWFTAARSGKDTWGISKQVLSSSPRSKDAYCPSVYCPRVSGSKM